MEYCFGFREISVLIKSLQSFFFFNFKKFYWDIVDLQCCMPKWFRYIIYIWIYNISEDIFIFSLKNIYLAALNLSCSTGNLRSSLWHAGCRIFSWGMQLLAAAFGSLKGVTWPGIKLGPPALRAQCLRHWTTREVPIYLLFYILFPL